MASTQETASSNKLFVRHSMKTNYVVGLNAILSEEHKDIILKTSFAWFLELHEKIKIGRNILSDLLIRWVDERGGFIFGKRFVEFKEVDVSLGLGLGLVGEVINLNEKIVSESECGKYFDKAKGKYDLEMIYNFVLKEHKNLPCLDVCRLYVLVGISEVLLPSRSKIVFPILFNIVDGLSDLSSFCWGRIVYNYLLSSFCKACLAWNGGKGASTVYVDGCVYVFQIWFCDRFVPSNTPVHKYPRILHWMTVNVGDKFIKVAMEKGVMLDEYGGSRKEVELSSLKASVDEKPNDGEDEYEAALDEVLDEQDVVIKELEEELLSLKAELVEEINNDEGGTSTSYEERVFYNDFGSEGRIATPDSDNNKRPRRRRIKSIACRTPYTGYSPNLG